MDTTCTFDHARTFKVRDGRLVETLVGGCVSAKYAVVMHHGTPCEASFWLPWHLPCKENGILLVALSRPGCGLSDRQPGRCVSSVVEDVEDILDALTIQEFATLGYSGGGPFALACAAHMQKRCKGVAIAGSLGHFAAADFFEGVTEPNATDWKNLVSASIGDGPLWNKLIEGMATPYKAISSDVVKLVFKPRLCDADGELLETSSLATEIAFTFRRCLREGVHGMLEDYQALMSRPWGFELSSISIPTYLYHADDDRITPISHGEWLFQNLPMCTSRCKDYPGHFGWMKEKEAILKTLVAHVKPTTGKCVLN